MYILIGIFVTIKIISSLKTVPGTSFLQIFLSVSFLELMIQLSRAHDISHDTEDKDEFTSNSSNLHLYNLNLLVNSHLKQHTSQALKQNI